MASLNDINIKAIRSTRTIKYQSVPYIKKIPESDGEEGFFFHHFPLRFGIQWSSKAISLNSTGFLYLTNKRLVLLPETATHEFTSFGIRLNQVVSFKTRFSATPSVVELVACTWEQDKYAISLTFHHDEIARAEVFKDYLKMIMETEQGLRRSAAQGPRPQGLAEATVLAYEMPPDYRSIGSDASLADTLDHTSNLQEYRTARNAAIWTTLRESDRPPAYV